MFRKWGPRQCQVYSLRAHTPSTALRHPPPNSARFSYATEGVLVISAQLSSDAVSALRKVWVLITLRASLSGTFLQTLPDLVTSLKGHSFSPRSCPPHAVSALRKVWVLITLRASLSNTFLQTLPDLVTPLKGHSLFPRSWPPTRSTPSARFRY